MMRYKSIMILIRRDLMTDYDRCWHTGVYLGEDCEMCSYKGICSGYEDKDEDDDED